jgi:hypothetical protein
MTLHVGCEKVRMPVFYKLEEKNRFAVPDLPLALDVHWRQ